jgi:hypothetical protein
MLLVKFNQDGGFGSYVVTRPSTDVSVNLGTLVNPGSIGSATFSTYETIAGNYQVGSSEYVTVSSSGYSLNASTALANATYVNQSSYDPVLPSSGGFSIDYSFNLKNNANFTSSGSILLFANTAGAFDYAALYQGDTLLETGLTANTSFTFNSIPLSAGSNYDLIIQGSNPVDRFNDELGFASFNGVINTVSAVPEAGEWAMMLLGLPLLGWVVRRKQSAMQIATA